MNGKFAKGFVVGAIAGGLMLGASAAVAGTGIGAVFNLGTANTANGQTVLQGSTRGQQLRVVNNSTATGATGIGIHTAPGKPPLVVDSNAKVNNLDADLLDGKDSSTFVSGGGSIVSARRDVAISNTPLVAFALPGFATLQAACALTGFTLEVRNATNPSTALDQWFATNGETRFVQEPASNDSIPIAIDVKGEQLFSAEITRTGHTVTMTTAADWTPTGCVFDTQAVVQ